MPEDAYERKDCQTCGGSFVSQGAAAFCRDCATRRAQAMHETGLVEFIAVTCPRCRQQWIAAAGREAIVHKNLRDHVCAADLEEAVDDLRSRLDDLEDGRCR